MWRFDVCNIDSSVYNLKITKHCSFHETVFFYFFLFYCGKNALLYCCTSRNFVENPLRYDKTWRIFIHPPLSSLVYFHPRPLCYLIYSFPASFPSRLPDTLSSNILLRPQRGYNGCAANIANIIAILQSVPVKMGAEAWGSGEKLKQLNHLSNPQKVAPHIRKD